MVNTSVGSECMFGGREQEHWHIQGAGASDPQVLEMEYSQYSSGRTRNGRLAVIWTDKEKGKKWTTVLSY